LGASLVCRVDSTKVAGLGCLDCDLGGLKITNLADHDDIRVLAQESAQAEAKVSPTLGLTLTWLTPGRLISAGSSAVEMFRSSVLRMLSPVYK
jgi:hypothetical protein